MGEQRIARGSVGPVSVVCVDPGSKARGQKRPAVWRARARVRLQDGSLVQLERRADTKAGAVKNLSAATAARVSLDLQEKKVSRSSTLRLTTAAWLQEVEHDTRLAPNTRRVYALLARRHILNSHLAGREMRYILPGDLEDLLRQIGRAGAAKTARSVLSKIFARAVRRGECERNIVRDCEPVGLQSGGKRDTTRALTEGEVWAILAKAYGLPWGAGRDLQYRRRGTADLCAFMLSTGLRIGEALAIGVTDIDFDHGSLTVRGTVTRVKGQGLRKTRPKTTSSDRVIPLHGRTLAQCRRLLRDGRRLLFPSQAGTFRDPSNTNRDITKLLRDCGIDWATSHTFRRTVLTRLGDKGVPLRLIADLAGHSNTAMTARKYLGRRGPDERLREAL